MINKLDKMHKYFRQYHIERLKDPRQASAYLEVALEEFEADNNAEAFLLALNDVAKAKGGISKLAHDTGASRTSLYKGLSAKGNPKLTTIINILKALNFKMKIEPDSSVDTNSELSM